MVHPELHTPPHSGRVGASKCSSRTASYTAYCNSIIRLFRALPPGLGTGTADTQDGCTQRPSWSQLLSVPQARPQVEDFPTAHQLWGSVTLSRVENGRSLDSGGFKSHRHSILSGLSKSVLPHPDSPSLQALVGYLNSITWMAQGRDV